MRKSTVLATVALLALTGCGKAANEAASDTHPATASPTPAETPTAPKATPSDRNASEGLAKARTDEDEIVYLAKCADAGRYLVYVEKFNIDHGRDADHKLSDGLSLMQHDTAVYYSLMTERVFKHRREDGTIDPAILKLATEFGEKLGKTVTESGGDLEAQKKLFNNMRKIFFGECSATREQYEHVHNDMKEIYNATREHFFGNNWKNDIE